MQAAKYKNRVFFMSSLNSGANLIAICLAAMAIKCDCGAQDSIRAAKWSPLKTNYSTSVTGILPIQYSHDQSIDTQRGQPSYRQAKQQPKKGTTDVKETSVLTWPGQERAYETNDSRLVYRVCRKL